MWGTEMVWLIALGGFAAFVCNVLYMVGGTEGYAGKWLRRFLGSGILAIGANVVALGVGVWRWEYLLMYPCLAIGMSIGYGGDDTLIKMLRRTLFALGVLSACIVGLFITGFSPMGWVICGLALVTGLTSVALGVINPFNNAPLEQFIICQVLTLFVPFWAFVK